MHKDIVELGEAMQNYFDANNRLEIIYRFNEDFTEQEIEDQEKVVDEKCQIVVVLGNSLGQ